MMSWSGPGERCGSHRHRHREFFVRCVNREDLFLVKHTMYLLNVAWHGDTGVRFAWQLSEVRHRLTGDCSFRR
jgi:hypothetical protein